MGNECGECGGNFDVVADEPLVLYQLCGVGDHTTTLRLGEGAKATGMEISVLFVGCLVSFIVSMLVIKALMEYVRKSSFSLFGVYRIILGVMVLLYFILTYGI